VPVGAFLPFLTGLAGSVVGEVAEDFLRDRARGVVREPRDLGGVPFVGGSGPGRRGGSCEIDLEGELVLAEELAALAWFDDHHDIDGGHFE